MNVKIESNSCGEIVNAQSALEHFLDISDGDLESIGHLLDRIRPRLSDMIATDTERIESGNILGTEFNHIPY